jgi:putative glutamine amidotransferase
MVNSTHHQAASRMGAQVVVSAASPDGVVEAIESTQYAFALGVQWHPELMLNTVPIHVGVYRTFIQKAREHRR